MNTNTEFEIIEPGFLPEKATSIIKGFKVEVEANGKWHIFATWKGIGNIYLSGNVNYNYMNSSLKILNLAKEAALVAVDKLVEVGAIGR